MNKSDMNKLSNSKMKLLPSLALIVFMSFSATGFVQAQSAGESASEETKAEDNSQKITTLPPAYGPQMLRLSEILGSLHYIRELCGADEGSKWRDIMQDIIKQEEPVEERKAQMIANFNHGFRGFQETYRECTKAALEANRRYIAEGIKLSGEIPTRYGR
jgi:uncharacterized protein (TIGR02301 family)